MPGCGIILNEAAKLKRSHSQRWMPAEHNKSRAPEKAYNLGRSE